MRKIYSILLSLLLLFTMSGNAFADALQMGAYSENGVIKYHVNGDISGGTVTKISDIESTIKQIGTDPVIGDFASNPNYSSDFLNGYKLHLDGNDFIFMGDKIVIQSLIDEVKPSTANLVLSAPNGVKIGPTAEIYVNSLVVSGLGFKETNITALKNRIINDKEMEFAVNDPSSKYRYAIVIENGAKVKVTNRIDFAGSYLVNNNKVPANIVNNPVYTTTDGITFKLSSGVAVSSIASTTPVPGGKRVLGLDRPYYTPYPKNTVDPKSPDPLFLYKLQEFKELTPTSLNPDITNKISLNLGGTFMQVAPLDMTMLVNNLDTNSFPKNTIGAIAMNNSADHVLPGGENTVAVNELTPIGAASQVGNNGLKPIGAASQVGNDNANYDFVIPQAILE
jgi:hypothetical protein